MKSTFKYLYKNIDKTTQKRLWLYAAISFLSPVINLFGITAILPILNNILYGTATEKDIWLAFGMAALMLFSAFFDVYSARLSGRLMYEGSHKLSMKIYELTEKEDLLAHNERDQMTALSLVRTDTVKCLEILRSSVAACVSFTILVVFLGILIVIDGIAGALIALFVLGEMAFMYLKNAKKMHEFGERIREADIKTNGQVTTAYGAYKELRVEEDNTNFRDRYEKHSLRSAALKIGFNNRNAVVGVVMKNCIYMLMFLVLAVVMLLSLDMTAYISKTVVTVMLVIRILPLGNHAVLCINTIKSGEKSFECIKTALENLEKMQRDEELSKDVRKRKATFNKGIIVRDLCFSYPNGKIIFDHADMDIPAGSSVAIIGTSGAGKTTFLDVMLGLLKPQSGSIKYDDYDIVSRTDDEGPCRAKIGGIVSYIPQVVYMNGATVRDNVAFFERGDEDSKDTDAETRKGGESGADEKTAGTSAAEARDERIYKCLEEACILDDIKAMPDGLDTLIGGGGTNISGGQRQRIALARALYKQFEILIMDEATSALDSDTERAVMESIRKVKAEKTLIMVTHHDMISDECDIVYRIGDGKITRER